MKLSHEELADAVSAHAAIRRRQRLQPVGGKGDKVFPPTYPGQDNSPPLHIFERRRIEGEDVTCVLIDSVQSQANRLEESLLAAVHAGAIELPYIEVDFTEAGLPDVGRITSLDAPHRVYDAILRDTTLAALEPPRKPDRRPRDPDTSRSVRRRGSNRYGASAPAWHIRGAEGASNLVGKFLNFGRAVAV